MRIARTLTIGLLLSGSALPTGAQPVAAAPAPATASFDGAAACEAMRSPANGTAFAQIPDAPTGINSARVISAGGLHGAADNDLPEFCRVEGIISPTVGFLLRMPTKGWNGKFMMGGCGGPCGNYLEDRIDHALVRNYAVVTTDMGHKGNGWLFAYNNPQGQLDFAYRATHLTARVAKELIATYYGQRASRNYFVGCSTGGRQAMIEAQRFPLDFDGIVAGAPVYDEIGDTPLFLEWNTLVNTAADGSSILTAAKVEVLHKAVLAKCDKLDGLADGLLMDPSRCDFDPQSIVCAGSSDGAGCLTPAQVAVVRKFRDGARNSKGEKLYFGMPWGSEDQWQNFFGWVHPSGRQQPNVGFSITGYMGYTGKPAGPGYKITDFDYDRDIARMDLSGAMQNPVNPELSRLRAAGGKLILFTGWNDNNIPPEATVDYYQKATMANGGAAKTSEFFRMFMLPGVNHCRGGSGGGEVDWITAIENWVEKGQAPDMVMAYRPKQPYVTAPRAIEDYGSSSYSKFGRHPLAPDYYDTARPVYPYPASTRYSGKGDPAKPTSWVKDKGR